MRLNAALRTHGTERFQGVRAVAVGYMPRGHLNVSSSLMSQLRDLGFHDARMQQETARGSAINNITTRGSSRLEADTDHHSVSDLFQAPKESQGQGILGGDVQLGHVVIKGTRTGWRFGLTFRVSSAQSPDDDDVDVLGHGPSSFACALDHGYKKKCTNCQGARGHRRAHYTIPAEYISTGVISFDLSGPHVLAKDKSLYFLVGALVNHDKLTVPCVLYENQTEQRRLWKT